MNKEQRKHYDKVARLGCVICRVVYGITDGEVELHHVRRYGAKRDNSPVVGLCTGHHRGNSGVHGLGVKRFEKQYGITCQELVEKTEELLNENNSK